MFGLIDIPIWTKSGGGVETINEPGQYVLYLIISLPQSVVGWTAKIPLTDWRLTVTKIGEWSGGSKLYVDVTNDKALVNQAITPLQINALLGIGLVAAFALLVDRISKVSPLLTIAIYGAVIIVLAVVYIRYVHPWLKGRRTSP